MQNKEVVMADITIAVANNSAVSAPKPSVSVSVKAAEAPIFKKPEASSKKSDAPAKKNKSREGLKDVISVSKDGDTAHASKESKSKLRESEQGNIIETRAKSQATKAVDFMYAQIATEELKDNLPNDAQVETQRVASSDDNPYIEALKEGLIDDIRQARFQQSAERLENIEMSEPKKSAVTQEELAEEAAQVKAAIKAAQQENESSFKPQITSFKSYSDQQLRQLYLEGNISRYSYDSEMSTRAEDNRKFSENEQVFREGIVRNIENEDRTERVNESIENAYSDEASQTLTAEQRMAMIGAAEEELAE